MLLLGGVGIDLFGSAFFNTYIKQTNNNNYILCNTLK